MPSVVCLPVSQRSMRLLCRLRGRPHDMHVRMHGPESGSAKRGTGDLGTIRNTGTVSAPLCLCLMQQFESDCQGICSLARLIAVSPAGSCRPDAGHADTEHPQHKATNGPFPYLAPSLWNLYQTVKHGSVARRFCFRANIVSWAISVCLMFDSFAAKVMWIF